MVTMLVSSRFILSPQAAQQSAFFHNGKYSILLTCLFFLLVHKGDRAVGASLGIAAFL